MTGTFTVSGVALSGGVQIEFGEYGELYCTGPDVKTPEVVHPVSALLRVPEEGADPGTFYCGGAGSALLFDADLLPKAVLRSVSVLGACPGEPVAGTIDICFGGGDCSAAVTSTVPGAELDVFLDGFLGVSGAIDGTEAKVTATMTGQGGFIVLQANSIDPDSSGMQTSGVGIGYVTIPAGQPDAGAVYCVGAGSTVDYSVEGFVQVHGASLKNLSRLGACPATPVDGEIGFCMNLN